MDYIDTHDVEVAFDELMKELNKLKDLNNLVDAYKDNIDALSSKVKDLTEQVESFYNSAKEHDAQVNTLYKDYVDKAEFISAELEKRSLEFKQIGRRNTIFNVITLILGVLACSGLAYLIFFA
jgi:uncharacterized coiled-coil DUF342 family protein